MFKSPDNGNYKYLVDSDESSSTDCENRGCSSDDYCRCSTIDSCNVKSNLSTYRKWMDNLYDGPDDDLARALAFWFLRLHFNLISWDWKAEGDYYGETLAEITIGDDGGFWNKLWAFKELSPTEQVHFLLSKEYGRVLDSVKDVKRWVCEPVLSSVVHNSLNKSYNTKILQEYKDFCRSVVYSDNTRKKFQNHVRILAPLCVRRGNGFDVVDGRHRCQALQSDYEYQEAIQKLVNKSIKTKGGGRATTQVVRTDHRQRTFTPIYMWIICPAKEDK